MTLDQGQEMTLTFNTHIFSLTQLAQAAIVSKQNFFFTFPTEKPNLQNLTLQFGLMLYVHGQHLRSCRDGQLCYLHCSWASLLEAGN